MFGIAGESHPVVRGVGFLGDDGDTPSGIAVTGTQGLDEAVSNHSVPDDDDIPARQHALDARQGTLRPTARHVKHPSQCAHIDRERV